MSASTPQGLGAHRIDVSTAPSEPVPFGRWVLDQVERGGFIGQLAKAAKADRGFPKDGDPEAVRKRISLQGADPEMHEALDDAELDWAAL